MLWVLQGLAAACALQGGAVRLRTPSTKSRLLMCEPPLSLDQLEDGWRVARKRLIEIEAAGSTFVPTADGGKEDWVHRIAAPERGCLLVAKPNVHFRDASVLDRSVLLLLEHGSGGGSLAILLNRPTEHEFGSVVEREELDDAFGMRPLHLGGTSAEGGNTNVFMLCETSGDGRSSHRSFTGDEEATQLLPGLWLASAGAAASRVNSGASPPGAFHFFVGAQVWSAGKLEDEFAAGAWCALAASSSTIAEILLGGDVKPEDKYAAALSWAASSDEAREYDDDADVEDWLTALDSHWSPEDGPGRQAGGGFAGLEAGSDGVPLILGGLSGLDGIGHLADGGLSDALGRGGAHDESEPGVGVVGVLGAVHAWLSLLQEVPNWPSAGKRLVGPSLSGVLGTAHQLLANPSSPFGESEEEEDAGADDTPSLFGLPLLDMVDDSLDPTKAWAAAMDAPVAAIAERCQQIIVSSTSLSFGGSAGMLHGLLANVAGRSRAALPSPHFALHVISRVLLSEAGALVIPDEQPAVQIEHLPLDGRLRALADSLAAHATHAANATSTDAPAPRVHMSSLQLGLTYVLVGAALGLRAELVEVDSSGLLLRVHMDDETASSPHGESPLFVSLEPGRGCGRTLEQSDLVPPPTQSKHIHLSPRPQLLGEPLPDFIEYDGPKAAVDKASAAKGASGGAAKAAERAAAEEAAAERALSPFEVGSLLAEEWGEAYRHVRDMPLADFWDLQRLTARRLTTKLEGEDTEFDGEGSSTGADGHAPRGGRDGKRGEGRKGSMSRKENLRGIVVRIERPDDPMDFGI